MSLSNMLRNPMIRNALVQCVFFFIGLALIVGAIAFKSQVALSTMESFGMMIIGAICVIGACIAAARKQPSLG